MRYLNLYISFCFLCFCLYSRSQNKEFDFVNVNEGESKVAVTTIIQDDKGFIWFGTAGVGVNRFDGINYKNYKHSLTDSISLSNNNVYCSVLDKKNRLWFGTEEGLNLYNRDLDQFIRVSLYDSENTEEQVFSIRSLCTDEDNNLFIGTLGNGVYMMSLDTFKVNKIDLAKGIKNASLKVFDLKCNAEGKVFAGTNSGLLEYDVNNKEFRYTSINSKKRVIQNAIYSLLIDYNDIWIGTESNGLIILKDRGAGIDGYRLTTSKITNQRIFSIVKLPDGSILCGSENDGLVHVDAQGKLLKRYLYNKKDENSLLSNSIWSLFKDKDNRIWLGYYNSGVSIYDDLYDKFNHMRSERNNKKSLSSPSVTGLLTDKNKDLWICMDGGGVDIYNTKKQSYTHINTDNKGAYFGLTSDYLECIFLDSKNNIWLGSWNDGVFMLPNGSNEFVNYNIENTKGNLASNSILSITEDADGIIWIGAFYKGLHSYNPKTKAITRHESEPFLENSLTEVDVRKVLVDSRHNVWVGTTQGLFKIIKDAENELHVMSYRNKMSGAFKNDIASNHVLTLYESSDNQTIWIGTRGAGLCKFNTIEETFTWFNKQNGFNGENIIGLVESEDGDLWISSNSGLYKYDTEKLQFTNYTQNDGLLSNDFNFNAAFRDGGGYLYFGNYQGVDYFNPNNISTNTTLPQVHLTDFKLFNKKVVPNKDKSPLNKVISETKEILLTHKQSVFTIEFTAINYTRPEKNQFAYYLEGLENSWNFVGNTRNATYTNLDYGTYVFKVKAANNDGLWNDTPNELTITILPPWWRTNVALFGYIVLFLIALYLLNRIAQDRIKEKQQLSYERETRRQKEDLNEKKFQFFTNISHEFRTPLTLIMNPLEDILSNKTLSIPEIVRTKLNTVHKNTNRLHRLITELLDFRKLELDKVRVKATNINLVSFIQDIISHFKEESLLKNIILSVDAVNPNVPVWVDKSMIEKIVFNLLSNAIKVTPDGGVINVSINIPKDKMVLPLINDLNPVEVIEITISDSGPGIDEAQIEKIFDRFYQVENLNRTYYGGTGIGLEVVKSFVHLHKGNIEVSSKLGKGTSFKIQLPAGKSHFEDKELFENISELKIKEEAFVREHIYKDSKKSSITDLEDEPKAQPSTLLIVEDNIELQNYLKNELKNEYVIHTADNGVQGVEIATKILPDVIITDVIMPEMDGFEFCKRIKSDIKTSHIPLLMLTAKARIDNRMEGIELGADAYMVKPFNLRLLKLRLSQLITSRRLIFNKYFSVISELPEDVKTTSIDKEFIEKVLNYINENISDPDLSVEVLASQLHLSKSQFYRKIKALTNQTANEFLRNIRLQKAKQILELGSANVGEVCYKVGFSSHSYFTKCFKNYYGILPTKIEVNK
ncbi:two-component regulator propeller domain-containing protein [uncultured Algibacter sp.]|uniref:hybrid sensor histidine kinase/response regulator transcription factor n=1 Tax=uncultured Algibacter sp. TaxID=298659 RepID=UPI00263A3255|nr:two-component regulator propeller domain-containing protein [uncultured Algibacter sp.]